MTQALPRRSERTARGFTLAETLIALVLVALAMTALVAAFSAASRLGVLTRRQANAVALARSWASTLNLADYTDVRLANNNTSNDATFADPDGLFARPALPTGADAPDYVIGAVSAFNENFDLYVNVAPDTDALGVVQGLQFAVIVRYKVGTTWARAVALGYRYNPLVVGVAGLPL